MGAGGVFEAVFGMWEGLVAAVFGDMGSGERLQTLCSCIGCVRVFGHKSIAQTVVIENACSCVRRFSCVRGAALQYLLCS